MNIIGSLKDVITFLQKSDNIDMVNKLISIQTQIISLQDEMSNIKDQNKRLKDIHKIEKTIVRYENDNVVSLKDNEKILYCSKCWDDERKLIQVAKTEEKYECPKCKETKCFSGKEPKYFNDTDNTYMSW